MYDEDVRGQEGQTFISSVEREPWRAVAVLLASIPPYSLPPFPMGACLGKSTGTEQEKLLSRSRPAGEEDARGSSGQVTAMEPDTMDGTDARSDTATESTVAERWHDPNGRWKASEVSPRKAPLAGIGGVLLSDSPGTPQAMIEETSETVTPSRASGDSDEGTLSAVSGAARSLTSRGSSDDSGGVGDDVYLPVGTLDSQIESIQPSHGEGER